MPAALDSNPGRRAPGAAVLVADYTGVMDLKVECYAGHRGEETPRRFDLGGRRVEVVEVVDRWYGPDHQYVKVLGDDGAIYILRYDDPADRWELKMFERRASPIP